jgi:mRNA-degrading endonuclease YafQ of YafQ-DinJ toxin-antitoxin module
MALVEKSAKKFYDRIVCKSPHGSYSNRLWAALSRTIIKPKLWDFFHHETDFGRQLSGFLPNAKFQDENEKSTDGLKHLIQQLKQEFQIKKVYCWHALHGYWRGVSPDLKETAGINVTMVYPKASKHLLTVEPQLEWDSVSLFGVGIITSPRDLAKFYTHLHEPLVEAGVDGVKVREHIEHFCVFLLYSENDALTLSSPLFVRWMSNRVSLLQVVE